MYEFNTDNHFLRKYVLSTYAVYSWAIHFLQSSAPQKSIFSSSQSTIRAPFVVQTTKMWFPAIRVPDPNCSCLLQNRKMPRIAHRWSKIVIIGPIAPTLVKLLLFFVFRAPFSRFSFLGWIVHFGRQNRFLLKNCKVAPSSLKTVRANSILDPVKR